MLAGGDRRASGAVSRNLVAEAQAGPKPDAVTRLDSPPMSDLQDKTRYEPSEVEPRIERAVAGVRAVPPRARGHARRELLDRDPAAERHRRAAHGPRAQRLDPGQPDPPQPDERRAHEVDPRHRPRRHRHPDPGRARAGRRGDRAARSSAARRSSSASGPGATQYGGTIIEQLKRLGASCDFDDERFTLDDAYAKAVLKVFVALYEKGYIYRDRYLVNWDPGSRLGDLRSRGRGPRGHRHAVLHRLPAGVGRRRDHGRDGAPGDDARRHRDRGEPRRRALPAPDRREGDPAARRAQAEDHRRRLRQARVRHRRAEDHARPRPQRLRDRPAATASRRSR